MHGFPRRPIAVLLCSLFAFSPAAYAVVEGGEAAAALRVERRLGQAERKKPVAPEAAGVSNPFDLKGEEDVPLFLIADQIQGQTEQLTEAEGNVELRKAGQLLYADRVRYQPLEDEVEASGNVRLLQGGAEVGTPYLKMRLSDQIGHADQARYAIVKEVASRVYEPENTVVTVSSINGANSGAPMMLNVPNSYGLPTSQPPTRQSSASGIAERIDFEGENHMRLTGATYSTCKPGSTDWFLKSAEMNLDYDNNEGKARDVSLWFQDVPLLYAPVAWFPLNQQRRSGMLNPSLSLSSRNGFDLSAPYYWNIAPNYDATFFPRVLGKRGVQLGVEARYLGAAHHGESRIEYLPDDKLAERDRYAYGIRHQQTLAPGLSAHLNWNGVSDDMYWEDMSSRLLRTSQTQLPKHAALNYASSPWWQSSLQVLRYQTLQPDPANPIDRPYFLEPRLDVVAYRPNVMHTDLSMVAQYSRFTHPTKVNGERVVVYPQVSLPIIDTAFQITPKFGVHASHYSLGAPVGDDVRQISRTLPIFSIDSTVVLERQDSWLGSEYVQTLEPRLYYVYIPYRKQSDIPLFDSGLADFNFAQIFSENRYGGHDRINDANQLTAAVTSRFLDGETGVELFKAMLGQRYYFKPQRVTITGETTRQEDFSNLVAAVNGLVAPKTYAEAAWEYSYADRTNERFSAGLRFQPDYGKVLSASYRYVRDPLNEQKSLVDQVDLSGQWPLGKNWYAVGRYNFSMRDSQLLEAIGGLEYNAGCWAVRGVMQRLSAVAGAPNDSFFLQLELNDFASLGSNPLSLLRRSVPGYGKTNELPAGDSLLNTP